GLYGLGRLLLNVDKIAQSPAMPIVQAFSIINLFWTILNLFPVLPLDGGQLMRVVLEALLGVKGLKIAIGASVFIAAIFGMVCLFLGWLFIGVIFLLFALQNVQSWKMSRVVSSADQHQEYHEMLIAAEEKLLQGKVEEAIPLLEKVRSVTQQGVLFITATQYLARIQFDKGQLQQAYENLISIKENLSDHFMMLLHFIAFEVQDYTTVHELGGPCFQREPLLEVAVRNAIASARLNLVDEGIGWLEAALRCGLATLSELVKDESFKTIKDHPKFKAFLGTHLGS
ncbi:MAG: hypothetical protein FJZ63_07630, partial [Chlamydiae bacterium]|nr:hypothetical protein [Chlamydiota bacterium]